MIYLYGLTQITKEQLELYPRTYRLMKRVCRVFMYPAALRTFVDNVKKMFELDMNDNNDIKDQEIKWDGNGFIYVYDNTCDKVVFGIQTDEYNVVLCSDDVNTITEDVEKIIEKRTKTIKALNEFENNKKGGAL